MDIIRAYTDRVAGYLPHRIRQEATDELYDSLTEQFEDQCSERFDLEQTDFIQQQPHPIRMATRLGQDESLYLIGPGFYLSFIEAIKITALVVAVLHVGLFALSVWTSEKLIQSFFQSLFAVPETLGNAVVIIAIVFFVLERSGERARWLDKWDARDLASTAGRPMISKLESLFDLNVSAILLLVLTGAIELPSILRQDGIWLSDLLLDLPDAVFFLLCGLLILDIIFAMVKLARRVWLPTFRWLQLVLNVAWIAALSALIQVDPLFSSTTMPDAALMQSINTGVDVALLIAVVITAWDCATHLYHLLVKKDGLTVH